MHELIQTVDKLLLLQQSRANTSQFDVFALTTINTRSRDKFNEYM